MINFHTKISILYEREKLKFYSKNFEDNSSNSEVEMNKPNYYKFKKKHKGKS